MSLVGGRERALQNQMSDSSKPDSDFAAYRQNLLNFIAMIQTVDSGLGKVQQTYDDLLSASLDLAGIIGPKWKDELRILTPALQSLQRRTRVLNAAIERFVKDIDAASRNRAPMLEMLFIPIAVKVYGRLNP